MNDGIAMTEAGTADRLAAAEAEADGEREAHRATARQLVETQMERIDAEREADEARARLAADLAHMTAKAANARSDADALAARLALWQSNTEGAIADAGDLPGDLTAWSAIRRLTAERDELRDPTVAGSNPAGGPCGARSPGACSGAGTCCWPWTLK
jgi:hypothetical protein